MISLDKHIKKLLCYHDYVVVPQLGGFVVQKQSAILYPDRITPPLSTIGFNPLMKHADGLLAIEIARSEGITYRKAVELIDAEVDNIKSRLTHTGIYKIEEIGTISKSETGHIQFIPANDLNFIPANLGLSTLYVPQIKEKINTEKNKVTFTLPSINTIRNAAAVILFFVLLGFSQQVNKTGNTEYADLSSIAFANLPEITVTPNTCTDTAIKNNLSETINTKDDNNLFHVVVASLPTRKSAEKFCNLLKEENFECAHVLTPVKTYRVVIQSFDDKQSAIEFMLKLRESDSRFSSAWVLCKH